MNDASIDIQEPQRSQSNRIESIRIRGFRSLADVQLLALPGAALLIGPNGGGKSNLFQFFEMLGWMLRSRKLAEYVAQQGGGDDQLFGGNRETPRLQAEISIRTEQGLNDYRIVLAHAHPDRLIITEEGYRFSRANIGTTASWMYLASGGEESGLPEAAARYDDSASRTARVILHLLQNCVTFQFHDTSDHSGMKMRWDIHDNNYLRSDGGNLAAILYRLQREDPQRYGSICENIARILPVFEGFAIEESYGYVLLRWKAKGLDKTIGAHMTSDGSLRFFALMTLLSLPSQMLPDVILLDEPELGLHPSAIGLIGSMMESRSADHQIIVATQSPLLVNCFTLDNTFVVEARDGKTTIRRVNPGDHKDWTDDGYSSGELWLMNALGGRP